MKLPQFLSPEAIKAVFQPQALTRGAGTEASILSNLTRVDVVRMADAQALRLLPQGKGRAGEIVVRSTAGVSLADGSQAYLAKNGSGHALILLTGRSDQSTVAISQQQLKTLLELFAQYQSRHSPSPSMKLPATVTGSQNSQLTIQLTGIKAPPIEVPVKGASPEFKVGQAVTLQLSPGRQGHWDLSLQQSSARASSLPATHLQSGLPASHKLVQIGLQKQLQQGEKIITTGQSPLARQLKSLITPTQGKADGMVQEWQLKLADSNTGNRLQVKYSTLTAQAELALPKSSGKFATSLPAGLKQHLPDAKTLSVTLPQLKAVFADPNKPVTTDKVKSPANETVKQTSATHSLGAAEHQTLSKQIQALSRTLLTQSSSPGEALVRLTNILSQPGQFKAAESQTLVQNILRQLNMTSTALSQEGSLSSEQDPQVKVSSGEIQRTAAIQPQDLRALLSAPALPVTSASLVSPVAQSSMLGGLVTLLQLTLAGRAIRQNPALASHTEATEAVVSRMVASASSTTSASPNRLLQDFAQLDSRQPLLEQLKTLLANHQQHKLSNAEARLQAQDSFYYVLPVAAENQAPPELLIKREDEPARQTGRSKQSQKAWSLTMKLDIGQLGQLLVKSRIHDNTLDLNLYTSTDTLLARVADTLPFLTRRLSALGLEVQQSSFQRGRIPASLQDKPYQVFETRV